MRSTKYELPILFVVFTRIATVFAQTPVEGYVFEQNNRGYISQVNLSIHRMGDTLPVQKLTCDIDGHFVTELNPGRYTLLTTKEPFESKRSDFEVGSQKVFLKVEMQRKPGYLFDASLAEARENPDQIVDAVSDARIEVYNRTKGVVELDLKKHPDAFFKHYFEPGNHYTMLIRKDGYLAKRIEVYVNIKGCILCVDGVRNLSPGVTDNLTAGNTMGTLIANIELQRAGLDKKIAVQNIHYDVGRWDIRPEVAGNLDNIVTLLQDNPGLLVEFGSHTDARGSDAANLALSQKRAEAAAAYIVDKGIDAQRISAKGYGETQPANRCKNGVECSDSEHEVNRRTVLRVIGMTAATQEKLPSLEAIIREEESASNAPKNAGNETTVIIEAMPADFNGVAIEIARHNKTLSSDFYAFQGHPKIYWRVEKDRKYYYYAPFSGDKTAAAQFLNKQVKPKNPEARLVFFEKSEKKYL
jgi:outer membrane protein OmpA-like peptidoglycan-associated protein